VDNTEVAAAVEKIKAGDLLNMRGKKDSIERAHLMITIENHTKLAECIARMFEMEAKLAERDKKGKLWS